MTFKKYKVTLNHRIYMSIAVQTLEVEATDVEDAKKIALDRLCVGGAWIDKVEESNEQKEVKGDWRFERSSGYAGYRCQKCGEWIYENKPLKCECDNVVTLADNLKKMSTEEVKRGLRQVFKQAGIRMGK